jgi:pimeloyl-ACP methyl ester carboxylesterase
MVSRAAAITDQSVGYYEEMEPPSLNQIITNLSTFAIEVRGSGPTVVLLHANPGSSSDFNCVAGHLAAAHRVVAVDWPGYGSSPMPALETFRGAMSYRDGLVELLDVLDSEHGWGPFVLVGNSVGGFAAIGTAKERPELVAGLVLVAPGGFTAQNPLTRWACRSLGRQSVAKRMAKPLARLYLRRRNETTRNAIATAGTIAHEPARRAVFAAVWRSFADKEHDLRHQSPPRVPTMLTWGRFDPVLPAFTDGRFAAKSLGVTLHLYQTGHEPYAELPSQWLHDVEPFLAGIPATTERWMTAGTGEAS